MPLALSFTILLFRGTVWACSLIATKITRYGRNCTCDKVKFIMFTPKWIHIQHNRKTMIFFFFVNAQQNHDIIPRHGWRNGLLFVVGFENLKFTFLKNHLFYPPPSLPNKKTFLVPSQTNSHLLYLLFLAHSYNLSLVWCLSGLRYRKQFLGRLCSDLH